MKIIVRIAFSLALIFSINSQANDLSTAAFHTAELYIKSSPYTCNELYDFKLLEPTYGTITHGVNEYTGPFKLSSTVDAIMTGVEYVCKNNTQGRKLKGWVYLVVANDIEFSKLRCVKTTYAGEYDVRFAPDEPSFSWSTETPRQEIEKFAQQCGFRKN